MDIHTSMTPTSALIYTYLEPCAFETPTSNVTTAVKMGDNPFDKAFEKELIERAVHDPFAHSFGQVLKQKDIKESVQPLNLPSNIPKFDIKRHSPSLPLSIVELKEFYMTSQAGALDDPEETASSQPEMDSESSTHYPDSAADFDIRFLSASHSSSVSSTESYQGITSEQKEQQIVTSQNQSAESFPTSCFSSSSPTSLLPVTTQSISASHCLSGVSYQNPARKGRGKARRRSSALSTDEIKQKHEAFLERNRVAAMKCRTKKKGWQEQLIEDVKLGQQKNEELKAQYEQLIKEVAELQSMALLYKKEDGTASCQCEK